MFPGFSSARMSEAAVIAFRLIQFVNEFKIGPADAADHHLGDAVGPVAGKGFFPRLIKATRISPR